MARKLAQMERKYDAQFKVVYDAIRELMTPPEPPPGVRLFTGSRHTYSTEKVLLASDDVWFYHNLEHLLPVPLAFDRDAYVREMQRMKTLVSGPDLFIPGHDPLVFSRFPKVAGGVVRIQ